MAWASSWLACDWRVEICDEICDASAAVELLLLVLAVPDELVLADPPLDDVLLPDEVLPLLLDVPELLPDDELAVPLLVSTFRLDSFSFSSAI